MYFLYSLRGKVRPTASLYRLNSSNVDDIILDIQNKQSDRAVCDQLATRSGWFNQRVDSGDNSELYLWTDSEVSRPVNVVQIADLFFVHHRGSMNGLYLTCVMIGVSLQPRSLEIQAVPDEAMYRAS